MRLPASYMHHAWQHDAQVGFVVRPACLFSVQSDEQAYTYPILGVITSPVDATGPVVGN